MMDILVRGISEEDAQALDQKAKSAGKDRSPWLADQLHKMAALPEFYAFRVIGQVGKGKISRHSNHVNGTGATFSNFNQDEADAMQRAENFVRRNQLGDKEKAYNVLVVQFGEDNVFEVPV